MTTAGVRAGIVKELRALFVPWLLILSAVIMAGLAGGALVVPIAVVGSISLGAWSIGHEYTHRTLALLLSQPVRRRTIATIKAVCLVLTLLSVCATAVLLAAGARDAAVIAVGLAGAISVAPWLTMVSRSTRGGILFTLALGLTWIMVGIRTGEAVAVRNPDRWANPFSFAEHIVYGGFVTIFVVAASMAWRRFELLSAVDEQNEHVTLPGFWRRRGRIGVSASTVRHPLAALFRKELGLQVPVLALSALYVLVWLGSWTLRPAARESVIILTTVMHGALVPLLAGALASAEERRMGTLTLQLLQPVSAGTQWAVKAVVVIGLAVLLAVGLPAMLQLFDAGMSVGRSLRQFDLRLYFFPRSSLGPLLAIVTLLATMSLYVSSLARNSVHGLLGSMATGVVLWNELVYGMRLAGYNGSKVVDELLRESYDLVRDDHVMRAFVTYSWDITQAYENLIFAMILVIVIGGHWLFLRFGNENHRFSDLPRARLVLQVIAILLVPVVAVALYYGLPVWVFGG